MVKMSSYKVTLEMYRSVITEIKLEHNKIQQGNMHTLRGMYSQSFFFKFFTRKLKIDVLLKSGDHEIFTYGEEDIILNYEYHIIA
jgi:hypothetical protein